MADAPERWMKVYWLSNELSSVYLAAPRFGEAVRLLLAASDPSQPKWETLRSSHFETFQVLTLAEADTHEVGYDADGKRITVGSMFRQLTRPGVITWHTLADGS